jgi:hypothetical protein
MTPIKYKKWDSFTEDMRSVIGRVKPDTRVRRYEDLFEFSCWGQKNVHGYMEPLLIANIRVLKDLNIATYNVEEFAHYGLNGAEPTSAGGIVDIDLSLKESVLSIIELEHPTAFLAVDEQGNLFCPFDLMNNRPWATGGHENVCHTIIQTYNYMLTKGELRFGFFSNYDYTCFLRRTVDDHNDEVLEISPFFKSKDVRLPLMYFLLLVFECGQDRYLKRGTLSDITIPVDVLSNEVVAPKEPVQLQEGGEPAFGGLQVGTTLPNGVTVTSTQEMMLGLPNFTLEAPNRIMLASSEKQITYLSNIWGMKLMWKQMDLFGLPRNFTDYTLENLQQMITLEITVYHLLKSFWGYLVPDFFYFGHDVAGLWVFVTLYEGVPLDLVKRLRKWTEFPEDIMRKAYENLCSLHKHGIIHGNVSPRSALYREKDGNVLWTDFEFSTILSEETAAEWHRLEAGDFAEFKHKFGAFSNVPPTTTTSTIPMMDEELDSSKQSTTTAAALSVTEEEPETSTQPSTPQVDTATSHKRPKLNPS